MSCRRSSRATEHPVRNHPQRSPTGPPITVARPALVWIESPTNPLLKIIDIEAVAKAAHDAGTELLVDNTFASPYFQNPIALGADVSLSSTT